MNNREEHQIMIKAKGKDFKKKHTFLITYIQKKISKIMKMEQKRAGDCTGL